MRDDVTMKARMGYERVQMAPGATLDGSCEIELHEFEIHLADYVADDLGQFGWLEVLEIFLLKGWRCQQRAPTTQHISSKAKNGENTVAARDNRV